MSEKSKELHKKLVDELNELEHVMEVALEENEHFHTLEHQTEKNKPPEPKKTDKS